MKPIDPSKYRRPLNVQKPVDTVDANGNTTRTWVDVFGHTVMGAVKPMGGRELLHATGQLEAHSMYQIAVRYNPSQAIDATMRILDGGKYYNIRNVNDVEELHREWQILAEETGHPE